MLVRNEMDLYFPISTCRSLNPRVSHMITICYLNFLLSFVHYSDSTQFSVLLEIFSENFTCVSLLCLEL